MEEGAYPSLRDEKQSEGGLEDPNCPWVKTEKTLLNNRLQLAYYTSPIFRWSEKSGKETVCLSESSMSCSAETLGPVLTFTTWEEEMKLSFPVIFLRLFP